MTGERIELPDRLPSLAGDLPRAVKNMLMERLWSQQVQIRDGVNGVIESLYRGEIRGDGQTKLRIGYLAPARECWPFIVEDTQRFMAQRAAEKAARQHPTIPISLEAHA